jgi:hypothetical protein
MTVPLVETQGGQVSQFENDILSDENGASEDAEEGVPPRFVGMHEVDVQFATGLHVTSEFGAFQLVFSRFTQPVFLSSADYEPYAKQGYVPVDVVSRIVVTPQVLEDMVRVLQEQLERSRTKQPTEQIERETGAE